MSDQTSRLDQTHECDLSLCGPYCACSCSASLHRAFQALHPLHLWPSKHLLYGCIALHQCTSLWLSVGLLSKFETQKRQFEAESCNHPSEGRKLFKCAEVNIPPERTKTCFGSSLLVAVCPVWKIEGDTILLLGAHILATGLKAIFLFVGYKYHRRRHDGRW